MRFRQQHRSTSEMALVVAEASLQSLDITVGNEKAERTLRICVTEITPLKGVISVVPFVNHGNAWHQIFIFLTKSSEGITAFPQATSHRFSTAYSIQTKVD
eukprot:scaffold6972_cov136-Amphora_coffeaeformis.AAC.1